MNKKSMQQYQEFQDYTNYIDTSDVMLGFYKDQPGTGLQKYYLMIQQWLNIQSAQPQDNKPLVIQAQGGVGKKTLLVKWFQYHQQLKKNKQNDLIILHFATTGGNNSNYYYAIYRILIKLRQQLNIGQKVQLHQQKLRNYFSYWLDVCNQKIQNQVIQNVDTVYNKIILVLQGIDYFADRGTGKQGNISFWLPKYFPKNVKVIVTADRQSQSMNYFNKLNCPRVNIPADAQIIKTMIKSHVNKNLCIKGPIVNQLSAILQNNVKQVQVTSLYVKSFLSCLLPEKLSQLSINPNFIQFMQKNIQKIDKKRLAQVKDVQSFFDYLLDFWSVVLFNNEQKFKQLIGLLISTQKGLTRSQIISITKIDPEQLKLFITIFRSFLMNFKQLWMIKNDSFKKSIHKKYQFNQMKINQKIAQALKKSPNSVRKLQQQTFQLYSAGNYFKLKQVISDIQNFLLLFNPYTKYDLCRYWQKLQQKSFDPVIQYNKAIQGFQMHYHPNSDDLFRIITQISRFLKQFSDFQTYYTPQFRHPKIIGNENQLADIGILGQFTNLQLCKCDQDINKKQNDKKQNQNLQESNQNQQQKKFKKKLKQMYDKIQQGKHIKKINKIQLQSTKGSKNKINKQNQKNNQKQQKQPKQMRVQQLNVQVKSNQNHFRQYYYNQIKPFLQKVSLQGQKQVFSLDQNQGQQYQQSDDEDTKNDNLVAKIKNIQKDNKQKSKFQNLPDLKNLYAKTVQQQFQLNQKPPTNYYYKRWIWMQFPWVCMTMKCDYSDKLRKCFTSPTSYMSVSQQRQFTIQALKIALQAKKKKQAILQKTQQPQKNKKSSKDLKQSTQINNDSQKINNQNIVDESKITMYKQKRHKKIEQLGFVTNSFLSLHNLSKQMESLNCINLNNDKKLINHSRINDQKNSLFITAQDANQSMNQSQSLASLFNKKKKKNLQLDQSINLSSTKSRQGLLPRIKQTVNSSMIKQLQQLQKNNAQIRKNMDNYLYKNKILAKRLKQLKIIQFNNKSQLKNQKKIQQKKQKIQQIQQKIQKVKYQYAHSLIEHQRLDVLIKICKRNKTHNQQKIPQLVLQCNNFKKMIKIQSESIVQLKKKIQQMKKLTKKFVSNYCQKIQNELQLQQQIKQTLKNRNNFQEQVQKYDKLIQQQIQQKRKQLNYQMNTTLNNQNQSFQKDDSMVGHNSQIRNNSHAFDKNKSKAWNIHQNQQQNYEEMYKQIAKYFDINDQNYQNNKKYIKLVQGLQKKRQFQAVLQQRRIQLQQLKKKHHQLKIQLETLDKAKQQNTIFNDKINENNDSYQNQLQNPQQTQQQLQKQLADKKRTLTKATDIKLACLGMLNTWYVKLGLPQQKNLIITKQFVERLQQIKVMNQIQTC